MELSEIRYFFAALRPYRALPQCAHCEPLQVAFARLGIELAGISESAEKEMLHRELQDSLDAGRRLHPRLECGDCAPEALLDRIRHGDG